MNPTLGILGVVIVLSTLPSRAMERGPFSNPIIGAPDAALTVDVHAHRGGAGLAPENTLAAVRAALALGVEVIELAIRRWPA